jgi:hypothetical protein
MKIVAIRKTQKRNKDIRTLSRFITKKCSKVTSAANENIPKYLTRSGSSINQLIIQTPDIVEWLKA